MSVSGGPSIVTSNLLLNLEIDNPKSYSYSENLLPYSQAINTTNWSVGPNTTFVSSSNTAPDSTLTASSFYGNGSSANEYVVKNVTYAANTWYTASCWARVSNGTVPTSGNILTISYTNDVLGTLTRSTKGYNGNLTSSWQRFSTTYFNVAPGTYSAYFIADQNNTSTIEIWGAQVEKNTSMQNYTPTGASAITQRTTLRDTISTYSPTLSNTAYYNYNSNGTFTFTRSTAPNLKDGGGIVGTYPSGSLSYGNFLYNDYTWEIWFKIDDINAGAYDGVELWNVLAVYPGYHTGFMYSVGGGLCYTIWDYDGVTAGSSNPCYWSLGTSNAQVIQGNWYQAVVTNSNKTFTPYLNGVPLGTGSTLGTLRFNNLANAGTIAIGKAANVTSGLGSYVYYSRSAFGGMKMYNRALSADEVNQNFNALRGRYGL